MAADAVFIPSPTSGPTNYGGVSIEVQGWNYSIDVPVNFSTGPVSPADPDLSPNGAAGTDYDPFSPKTDSYLDVNDPHTGAILEEEQLSARLSDIAYTNGSLYGVLADPTAPGSQTPLQIVSIAANGKTQSVVNQSEPYSTSQWRLSGIVGGDTLLAVQNSFTAPAVSKVIDPAAKGVSLRRRGNRSFITR
jgi:hypothetical protein